MTARVRIVLSFVAGALLAACSHVGGSSPVQVPVMPAASTSGFALSPQPLELSSNVLVDAITAQGDTPGVAYTARAASSCSTPAGAIAIAGDGQAQIDVAGAPLLFLAYVVGSPPGACVVAVTGSNGDYATAEVTYETIVEQTDAVTRRFAAPLDVSVQPASATISSAGQVLPLVASGFSGTVTASAGGCASGSSGLTISPTTLPNGGGTFDVAPFGQGAIAKSCTITFSDGSGKTSSVAVTIAIDALAKFVATPRDVQFGCAGSSPAPCRTLQNLALIEPGAQTLSIVTRPSLKDSCANAFDGPLKMLAADTTLSQNVAGPSATVAFQGLLLAPPLDCSKIVLTDNGDPAQRVTIAVDSALASPPPGLPAAVAPPCVGPDPYVAAASAPHGMYVWNPYAVDGGEYEAQLEQYVIGKDPTLCGVSLVVDWSDLEPQKGTFDWNDIDTLAKPYLDAGLTVNLLFAAGPERGPKNPVTPAWVTASTTDGGDGVPIVQCDDQPPAPDYLDPTFEADWHAFIAAAVEHFSYDNSTIAPSIGYMRFAIGFGVEAIPAHFDDGAHADCLAKWEADPIDFTYDNWVAHAKGDVNAMGRLSTDKQLMVALNGLDGGPSIYDYPNAVAEDAADKGIGFGTENLGIANVAIAGAVPHACNPLLEIVNLYWCQAFTRHVGVVPYEFQTIVASTAPQPGVSSIVLGNALQYGLDNNTQIFELYPQEWLAADVPGFTTASDQAAHAAALHDTALVLGAKTLAAP